jgi:flagellar export protein FliJ
MSETQRMLRQDEAQLGALRDEERVFREQFESLQGRALSGEALKLWLDAYRNLAQRIDKQEAAAAQSATRVEQARHVLLEAQRKEQVLDTLRTKRQRQYALDYAKHEQELLDERTIMRLHHAQ